jgi:hypothetical protein
METNAPSTEEHSEEEEEAEQMMVGELVEDGELEDEDSAPVPDEGPDKMELLAQEDDVEDKGIAEVIPLEEYLTSLPGKEDWARATLRCPDLAPSKAAKR